MQSNPFEEPSIHKLTDQGCFPHLNCVGNFRAPVLFVVARRKQDRKSLTQRTQSVQRDSVTSVFSVVRLIRRTRKAFIRLILKFLSSRQNFSSCGPDLLVFLTVAVWNQEFEIWNLFWSEASTVP